MTKQKPISIKKRKTGKITLGGGQANNSHEDLSVISSSDIKIPNEKETMFDYAASGAIKIVTKKERGFGAFVGGMTRYGVGQSQESGGASSTR